MKRTRVIICFVTLFVGVSGCSSPSQTVQAPEAEQGGTLSQYIALRDDHVQQWSELETEYNRAWWEAALSGETEDFERVKNAEKAVRLLHSDQETYERLKQFRDSGDIGEPTIRRSLDLLFLSFQQNQIDQELMLRMVDLQNGLEQSFNTFRPQVNGEEVTSNQIATTLKENDDSEQRRIMWEASKEVGPQIVENLVELATLRNQAANALGFANYYEMMLHFREQDPQEIRRVFDELATMTDEPFRAAKADLDAQLAQRFGVEVSELRPWHYADPFFQETPDTGVEIDPLFANDEQDHLVGIAVDFYSGIGLPVVTEILERSDLYERDGKVEHAFCADIDREGDVRILTNLRNNTRWMSTLMHELGHGVYDAHIDHALPFELRRHAHILTTEGVAELFGTLVRDPVWLRNNVEVPDEAPENFDDLVRAQQRLDLLIFARWSLVMLNFERGFYEDPTQDLNQLWWDLVERYQGLRRPDSMEGRADFAAKIHFVVAPVYYHNYIRPSM